MRGETGGALLLAKALDTAVEAMAVVAAGVAGVVGVVLVLVIVDVAGGEGVKARESDSAGVKLPPRSWAEPKRYLSDRGVSAVQIRLWPVLNHETKKTIQQR